MIRVCDWVVTTLGLDSGYHWIIDDTGFPNAAKQAYNHALIEATTASVEIP